MEKEKKVVYESPVTREVQVSLESGICIGSEAIRNDGKSQDVGTTEHKFSSSSFSSDYFGSSWD